MSNAARVTPLHLRSTPDEVATVDGARARVEREGAVEFIVVADARGHEVFRYCESTGEAMVRAPGAMAFEADGDLTLSSEASVDLRGAHGVRIESGRTVELRGGVSDEPNVATVSVGNDRVAVRAPRLETTAARADVAVGVASVVGRRIDVAADSIKRVVEVLETQAGRIVERAKNIYQDASGVSQTRAGRIRMVARAALSLVTQRATVRAEQDVRIKGEKIHLA